MTFAIISISYSGPIITDEQLYSMPDSQFDGFIRQEILRPGRTRRG